MLSFISTLLVARWLSLGDYGLMALVGIWTGIIVMVADMGLGWAIVQFPAVKDEELQGCFWVTLLTTTTAYIGLFAFAPVIARWFNSPDLTDVLRVSSATLLLFAFRLVPDAMIKKALRLDKIAQVGNSFGVGRDSCYAGLGLERKWCLGAGLWRGSPRLSSAFSP